MRAHRHRLEHHALEISEVQADVGPTERRSHAQEEGADVRRQDIGQRIEGGCIVRGCHRSSVDAARPSCHYLLEVREGEGPLRLADRAEGTIANGGPRPHDTGVVTMACKPFGPGRTGHSREVPIAGW